MFGVQYGLIKNLPSITVIILLSAVRAGLRSDDDGRSLLHSGPVGWAGRAVTSNLPPPCTANPTPCLSFPPLALSISSTQSLSESGLNVPALLSLTYVHTHTHQFETARHIFLVFTSGGTTWVAWVTSALFAQFQAHWAWRGIAGLADGSSCYCGGPVLHTCRLTLPLQSNRVHHESSLLNSRRQCGGSWFVLHHYWPSVLLVWLAILAKIWPVACEPSSDYFRDNKPDLVTFELDLHIEHDYVFVEWYIVPFLYVLVWINCWDYSCPLPFPGYCVP